MADKWYAVRSLDALKPNALYTIYDGEPVDAARYAALTRRTNMPTECKLCHEMYEKADDDPQDICPDCEEAAYYAWLHSQMEPAGLVAVTEDGADDDQGYCGPTCGRFGNW